MVSCPSLLWWNSWANGLERTLGITFFSGTFDGNGFVFKPRFVGNPISFNLYSWFAPFVSIKMELNLWVWWGVCMCKYGFYPSCLGSNIVRNDLCIVSFTSFGFIFPMLKHFDGFSIGHKCGTFHGFFYVNFFTHVPFICRLFVRHNLSPLFIPFRPFNFLCYLIITTLCKICLSSFHLWACVRVTFLPNFFFLCSFIFVFCIILQVFFPPIFSFL